MEYINLSLTLLGALIVLYTYSSWDTTLSILIIVALLITPTVVTIYYYILTLLRNYKETQNIASWDNPAGNILPYDSRPLEIANPPPFDVTEGFLRYGVPLTREDKIWGTHYGSRETYNINNISNKKKAFPYIGSGLTSCKEDRTKCLPIPSIAVSHSQLYR